MTNPLTPRVDEVLAEMTPCYGSPAGRALGVPMNRMQSIARAYGPDHALAEALWDTWILGYWVLRSQRRAAARAVASRLAVSKDGTARRNGKDALRAFAKADAG